MSIKLLAPYDEAISGDIITRDSVTEAALVAAGLATTTLTGGTFYPRPADAGASSPWPVGPFGGSLFFVNGTTDAAFRVAEAQCLANGGGTIVFPPTKITLTAPIVMREGFYYLGTGAAPSISTEQGGKIGLIVEQKGTVLDCVSRSFNAFEYNPNDLGAITGLGVTGNGGRTGINGTTIQGGGIRNISIVRAAYGIKIGAKFNGGIGQLQLDGIGCGDCSQWGIWLENCHVPALGNFVMADCSVGQFAIGGSGGTQWNFGNSKLQQVVTFNGTAAGGGRGACQGILIFARETGSQFNDLKADHLTTQCGQSTITAQSLTLTNGNSQIACTDLSKFTVDWPIQFLSSSLGGITQYVTYYVVAKQAATGAGWITISLQYRGTTLITPNAPGAITATVCAGSGLMIAGWNGAVVNAVEVGLTDLENTGNGGLLLQNTTGVKVTTGNFTGITDHNDIVMRANGLYTTQIHTLKGLNGLDSDQGTYFFSGVPPTRIVQPSNLGVGVQFGQATAHAFLNISGSGAREDLFYQQNTGLLKFGGGIGLAHGAQGTGNTINTNQGSVITVVLAGAGTQILPDADTNWKGAIICIVNPSAFACTVSTTSSQSILAAGVSAVTNTLAANSAAMYVASFDNTTYRWARCT